MYFLVVVLISNFQLRVMSVLHCQRYDAFGFSFQFYDDYALLFSRRRRMQYRVLDHISSNYCDWNG